MELSSVLRRYPQGANNFEQFKITVSSKGLEDIEPQNAASEMSYTDPEGVVHTVQILTKVVLYDHVNKVYYSEELKPYIKERLTGKFVPADKVVSYKITSCCRQRISQRSFLEIERCSAETASEYLVKIAGTDDEYGYAKGVLSQHLTKIIKADGTTEYVVYFTDHTQAQNYRQIRGIRDDCENEFGGLVYADASLTRAIRNGRREKYVLSDDNTIDWSLYTQCPVCGVWSLTEQMLEGDDGELICEYCSNILIYSYHGSPNKNNPTFFKCEDEQPTYYFGIEVESQGPDDNKNYLRSIKKYISLERDGSIGQGFEIISQPMSYRYWHEVAYDKFNEAFNNLSQAGQKGHDASGCGLHIHVSRSAFVDKKAVDKFIAIINVLQKPMEIFARRYSNSYYKYQSKLQQSNVILHPRIVEDGDYCYSSGHHCAVNNENRNTVEVRIFKSTLKFSTVMASIELVNNVVKAANDMSMKKVKMSDLVVDGDYIQEYWATKKADYDDDNCANFAFFYLSDEKFASIRNLSETLGRRNELITRARRINEEINAFNQSHNNEAISGLSIDCQLVDNSSEVTAEMILSSLEGGE